MKRAQLTKFLNDYFGEELLEKAADIDSKNANGLQLKGASEVTGVAFGVSASLEFFQKAAAKDCNFLIVHHGLRFHSLDLYINDIYKKRLQFLLNNNFTLCGYHFVLDHHPEIGNNAQILKKLGAERKGNFYKQWGWVGELEKEMSVQRLRKRAKRIFKRKPLAAFLEGGQQIKKIAVVSGGGSLRNTDEQIKRLLEEDIDLYITGEAHESTQATCREGGINYLAYGHYDTEVFGVQALKQVIEKEFPNLKTEFIKITNPL